MKIALLRKKDSTPELQNQIRALFQQLAPTKKQLQLHEMFNDKNDFTLVYGIKDDEVLGMASMCVYSVISGKKAWIEDVVVHEDARGKGLGRKLMQKLLEVAKDKAVTEILLFSAEHRVAAKQLYENLGFEMSASKLYKLPL
tara:strand:+ start:111524 stop:111949 length:426 start_codon:yes stop_codon:yes gene_type:complete